MKKMAFMITCGTLLGAYLVLPTTKPAALVSSTANTAAMPVAAAAVKTAIATEKPVFIKQVMKQQMQQVAQTYENNMRFPKYSKPLSKKDWSLLNPRAFVANHKPLDVGTGISAAIVLKQYIVSSDDNLNIEVSIHMDDDTEMGIEQVSAFLSDAQPQGTSPVAQLTPSSAEDGKLIFSGQMPSGWLSDLEHKEHQLFAQVLFANNETAKLSATFKLVGNDATLTSLSSAYVEGAHLMIPAHFDVQVEGRYRVRANLFDEKNQPVSHLNSIVLLTDGNTSGVLKVHAATLRNQGSAGPYILKDFDITRGPAGPGQGTHYGSSAQAEFSVNGFDLNFYSDEEYSNPKNQKRLEFLKAMANTQLTH